MDLVASSYRTSSSQPGSIVYVPELGSGAFEQVDPDGLGSSVGWVEGTSEFLLLVIAPAASQRAVAAALAIHQQLGGVSAWIHR